MARRQPEALRAANLAELPWLVHGFSTRHGGVSKAYGGGSLNLGFTAGDERDHVVRNRELFLAALGAQEMKLVNLRQIHSGMVHAVEAPLARPLRGDGLIARRPGLLLGVLTADCLPVMVADRRRRALGIFHAGWRGTVQRIVERGVGAMRLRFGSRPEDLLAAIGPGIQKCCFAVGEEVVDTFTSQFAYTRELLSEKYDADPIKEKYPLLFMTARAPGHSPIGPRTHLDLAEANRRQLLAAGVPESQIEVLPLCTACRTDLLFSHRAEGGYTGRMLAVIGVRG